MIGWEDQQWLYQAYCACVIPLFLFLLIFFSFFKMVLFLSFSFCVQFNIMNRFYFFMPMFLIHFVVACFSKKRFTRKRKKQRMHMLKTSFSLLKWQAQVITIISTLSQMRCCWQMSFSPLEVYLLNIMVQIQHAPWLEQQAALKLTGIELDLYTDMNMHLRIKEAIRGGISVNRHRFAKGNVPELESFEENKLNKNLVYLDAKNQY